MKESFSELRSPLKLFKMEYKKQQKTNYIEDKGGS